MKFRNKPLYRGEFFMALTIPRDEDPNVVPCASKPKLWKCPKCGSDHLDVQITTWASLTQDKDGDNFETDPDEALMHDHEWDEKSSMQCRACGYYDASIAFQVESDDEDDEDDGDADTGSMEFSESPKGYQARERWAESYDDLNGAPEGDGDR